MFTLLQATDMLKIILHENHGKETWRIVNDQEELVAKVNGPANIEICVDMVRAYNQREQLRGLLRNRLIDLLKNVQGSSAWAVAIRRHFREGGNKMDLINELSQQANDCPGVMENILGGEALQILLAL